MTNKKQTTKENAMEYYIQVASNIITSLKQTVKKNEGAYLDCDGHGPKTEKEKFDQEYTLKRNKSKLRQVLALLLQVKEDLERLQEKVN